MSEETPGFNAAQRAYDTQDPPREEPPSGTVKLEDVPFEWTALEVDVDEGNVTVTAAWILALKITDAAILAAIENQLRFALEDAAHEVLEQQREVE